ncbi:MAG: helix-turn-helix transcriptional regulator [Nanoarchaeota archaeon]|nr:helix-turn-helix transcriptional regulator [Nanoarchaeota archaeon]
MLLEHTLLLKDLAKKVGVRRETIVFLEQGKYNPSLQIAHDVAKALKSSIEEIFLFWTNLTSRPLFRQEIPDNPFP